MPWLAQVCGFALLGSISAMAEQPAADDVHRGLVVSRVQRQGRVGFGPSLAKSR